MSWIKNGQGRSIYGLLSLTLGLACMVLYPVSGYKLNHVDQFATGFLSQFYAEAAILVLCFVAVLGTKKYSNAIIKFPKYWMDATCALVALIFASRLLIIVGLELARAGYKGDLSLLFPVALDMIIIQLMGLVFSFILSSK